ncbi:MAG: DNA repair protein RecN [Moraxellaceae bacterium]|nr:DNA repair protein RecN [Moraxellaceae bacterium]
MLLYLSLHQFALIPQHEVRLVDGFNVITGETGAGKSLLLDALSLCIGERADTSMVRHGAESADIYAEFYIKKNNAVKNWFAEHERSLDDDEILIRRQLSNNGRSKAWLNGTPVSIAELKSLGKLLVNIHGQHAQQELLKPVYVVDWLDSMAGISELAKRTRQAFQQHHKLKRQADEIIHADAQRTEKIEFLQSQLADIEPLLAVDFEEIESEHEELSNLESLMQEAGLALYLLDNDGDEPDVSELLSHAIKICDNQSSISATFEQICEQLYIAQQQINEASSLLTDYAEQQLPNPERLQELDNLMSLAHRLSRKYFTPANELKNLAEDWQQQLDELLEQPSSEDIKQQVAEAWQHYLTLAEELSQARQSSASDIEQLLIEQVQPLALPNARCEFSFVRSENASDYTAQGLDDIDLLFSANVGMPMQPLYKIASGGELSRMALVMQVLLATHSDFDDAHPMLVFDEVDVGISGGTAQVVGELLRGLGKRQQLLAITHQAQVASQAHEHILVQKRHNKQSESVITVITGEDKVDELARMSGGVHITEVTKEHARSLLAEVE